MQNLPRRIATTRWSVIARARSPTQDGRAALQTLCELYWYPLYSFARRAGHPPEDAADLTQEFLTRFLERNDVDKTSPARGRFRSYLLQAMRNFLANEWRRERAQKRGGGDSPIRIDAAAAEGRYADEPADIVDPEQLYLRRFAMIAIGQALVVLKDECRAAGKEQLFEFDSLASQRIESSTRFNSASEGRVELLSPVLVGELEPGDYQRLSMTLAMSAGAIKVAVHRLKKRFQDHVRAQIRDTIDDDVNVGDEITALLAAL